MSSYLSKVEAHPDLEGSILRATKIHKVLKAMIRLDSIPKDDVYQFKKRSRELLDRWNKTLAADPTDAADKDEDGKPDDTGVNKTTKDEATAPVEPKDQIASIETDPPAGAVSELKKALENGENGVQEKPSGDAATVVQDENETKVATSAKEAGSAAAVPHIETKA